MKKTWLVSLWCVLFLFTNSISAENVSHRFNLYTDTPVPVQVKVALGRSNSVQGIFICNTSPDPIPLKNIEFDFNYAAQMPSTIWGQPWLNWQLVRQQGTKVILKGGVDWAISLPSDPSCKKYISILFPTTSNMPNPTGPFVFKAAGGVPVGSAAVTVNLSSAPAANLPSPQITLQGPNTNVQQVINWGGQWKFNNLIPGSYKISASPVNNGQDFFTATPINVTLQDGDDIQQTLQYQLVPSGKVTVTLVNAPSSQEPVTFTGNTYTLKQTISSGTQLTLPADTYTVSSMVAGFSATASPNPLVVPTNTAVTITYQQALTAMMVGYFQSWIPDSQTTDGTKTNLANLPVYVNVVNLAFMQPDATYTRGSLDFSGTGLQFNYSGSVLKQAIATLHQQHPATKVLVSVGGNSNTNWAALNAQAIADFVTDFGLDGVDVAFEPTTTGCALGSDNLIHCTIDTAFQGYIESLRSLIPRPRWITVAGWSVGAYGQDQWKITQPQSQYTGIMLPLFRSVAAKDIDMVNVMSYDAGTSYDPKQALAAYSNYYKGPISMGVEVPPEAWGGHVYNICAVNQLASAVKSNATQTNIPPAMMLWSLQKVPTGTPTPTNPNAQMIATAICTNLGLGSCSKPLLLNGFATYFDMSTVNCN